MTYVFLATEEVEKLYKASTKTRQTKPRNEYIVINRTEPVTHFYFVTIL